MAEPNVRCAWDELQIGDQVLKDGVLAFTIMSDPMNNQGIIGYRAVHPGGHVNIVTLSDREKIVGVRRKSILT